MKKLFIILAMAATLAAPVQAQKSLYRHNPQVVNSQTAADTGEVVAYSDTTGAARDTSAAQTTASDEDEAVSVKQFDDVSDPFTLIAYLADLGGPGSVLVAIAFVLLCILVVLRRSFCRTHHLSGAEKPATSATVWQRRPWRAGALYPIIC